MRVTTELREDKSSSISIGYSIHKSAIRAYSVYVQHSAGVSSSRSQFSNC